MSQANSLERHSYQLGAARALKSALEGPGFRTMSPERAFIDWYVRARYGARAKCEITDGAGDGGVDALITEGSVRVVLQSKYEPSLKLRKIGGKQLAEFENVMLLLSAPDHGTQFEEWLEDVRAPLRPRYRAIRRLALRDPARVRFDFVTTKRITVQPDERLRIIDIERVAPLWYLYEEGFTPPVESVSVECEDVWSTGSAKDAIRNYVGLADVRVFLALMDDDENERLFAQNVRTDLHTRINRTIRETYETEPETFWLGNNGLYVVCSRVNLRGRTLQLVYPSIINGSQTLHALHASNRRHRCRILVRVLEMDILGQRSMLNEIVRRTNTQNPMKAMNLAAHDVEQLNVARFLDRLMIFYERREKEWQNERKTLLHGYIAVGIKEVTQWLAVTQGGVGIGSVRSRVGALFQGRQYARLFSSYQGELNGKVYHRLALTVLSGLVVKRYLRTLSASARRRARIVQFLLVKAVYDALCRIHALDTAISEVLLERRFGKQVTVGVKRALSAVVTAAVTEQRRVARLDASIDLSNFFKRDDLAGRAYRKAFSSSRRAQLTKELTRALI